MAQLLHVNKKKETTHIEMTHALTLFVNYFNTLKDRARFGGHQHVDLPFSEFTYNLRRDGTTVTFDALESLFWACQVQADEGLFWHPYDAGCKRFIREVLNAQSKLYVSDWDRDYCLINVEKKKDGSIK